MKKILTLLFGLFLLTGCIHFDVNIKVNNDETESEHITILSPTGAPALALLDLLQSDIKENIVTVNGSDVLQAAFVNPDPEYDLIIAPTNLGAKLAYIGKTEYKLAAVLTWGNLYILLKENADLHDPNLRFAAFGETAVPGLIYSELEEQLNIQGEITWYNAVSDAQAAFLTDNADAALLAEPALSVTMDKAKQQDIPLNGCIDLQQMWYEKNGSLGYPQASIFVLESAYQEKKDEIDHTLEIIESTIKTGNDESNRDFLVKQIDEVGTDILGTPAGAVTATAYPGMNLEFKLADTVKDELDVFLKLFGVEGKDSIFLK